MVRDDAVKANGYTVNSYLNVLKEALPRCWSLGIKFMQDNAPIHTVKKILKWFKDKAISVNDWPP